jgi:hypothetical protein
VCRKPCAGADLGKVNMRLGFVFHSVRSLPRPHG